jgi:transcriptional regulator with XRE-family HTH domain
MPAPTALYKIPHLAEWRIYRRLTQGQLAEKVGIHRTSIAALEAGNTARIKTVDKLAEALGITVDQLLDVDEMPPQRVKTQRTEAREA